MSNVPPLRDREEYIFQDGNPELWVDEDLGIVYGVWICGREGKNAASRIYPLETLKEAIPLYEGCFVNLNHVEDDNSYRSFQDRFGWITDPFIQPNGLYGNLHYNKDHPEAKAFIWWVRNNPKAVGLSHDVYYDKAVLPNGRIQVARILKVNGVDLVAKPSTTSGLKEGMRIMDENMKTAPVDVGPEDEHYSDHVGKAVAAIMQDPELTMEQKKKKILAALKLMEEEKPEVDEEEDEEEDKEAKEDEEEDKDKEAKEDEDEDDDDSEAMEAIMEKATPKVKKFLAKIDAQQAQAKVARAKEAVRSRCINLRLPKGAMSDMFMMDLVNLTPAEQNKRIMERKALVSGKVGATSVARESVTEHRPKVLPPVKDLLKLAASNSL